MRPRRKKGGCTNGRRGGTGVYRQRGDGLLPELRKSGGTQPGRQAKEVLFREVPGRMEVEPPEAGELEVRTDRRLPGMREAVYGQPRIWESAEILQPRLR